MDEREITLEKLRYSIETAKQLKRDLERHIDDLTKLIEGNETSRRGGRVVLQPHLRHGDYPNHGSVLRHYPSHD
jgi:hypothetical protein